MADRRPAMRGIVAMAAAMLLMSCEQSGPAPIEALTANGTNVILISLDTLRADHLGCYGYHRETSPSIDEFARDSVLFKKAIAHAPSTLPSHASILTSLIPQHHGASFGKRIPLAESVLTLPEYLQQADYATASYNEGGQLAPETGIDQGFDTYEVVAGGFQPVVDKAISWLESNAGNNFFLFLHSYEVHHPYTPLAADLATMEDSYAGDLPSSISIDLLRAINDGEIEMSETDIDHIVSAYDAEIRSADRAFRRLREYLQEAGLYDEILIVLTSDHGEEFNEHGMIGWHSHTLFDELLHVPLIVKLPLMDKAGSVIETPVRGIDVAPTIIQQAGLPGPPVFEGRDLFSPLRGESPTAVGMMDGNSAVLPSSLRSATWKWIQGEPGRAAGRLFDLSADPSETVDVSAERQKLAREFEAELQRVEGESTVANPGLMEDLGAEADALLKGLGYLQ